MEQPTQTAPPAEPTAPIEQAAPPAVSEAPEYLSIDEMSVDQRREWERTGDIPTKPKADAEQKQAQAGEKPADAEDEASGQYHPDVAPYIKTQRPPGVSKRAHIRNELLRTVRELEAQSRAPQVQPQARQEPQQQTQQPQGPDVHVGFDPSDPEPTIEAFDQAHPIDEFATSPDPYRAQMAAFNREWSRWDRRLEQRASERIAHVQQARTQFAQKAQTWQERASAYIAANPEFPTRAQHLLKLEPRLSPAQPATPLTDLAEYVLESSIGPQLIDHLAIHPEAYAAIVNLPSQRAVFAALGALEHTLTSTAKTTASPAATAPKTVTSAPAAPTFLGSKTAEPVDEAAAALARGDFAAYEAAMNKRQYAPSR